MKKPLFGYKRFTRKRLLSAADCIQDIRVALKSSRDGLDKLTNEQAEAFDTLSEAMQITEIYIRDAAAEVKS
jgi:hypothetical protein